MAVRSLMSHYFAHRGSREQASANGVSLVESRAAGDDHWTPVDFGHAGHDAAVARADALDRALAKRGVPRERDASGERVYVRSRDKVRVDRIIADEMGEVPYTVGTHRAPNPQEIHELSFDSPSTAREVAESLGRAGFENVQVARDERGRDQARVYVALPTANAGRFGEAMGVVSAAVERRRGTCEELSRSEVPGDPARATPEEIRAVEDRSEAGAIDARTLRDFMDDPTRARAIDLAQRTEGPRTRPEVARSASDEAYRKARLEDRDVTGIPDRLEDLDHDHVRDEDEDPASQGPTPGRSNPGDLRAQLDQARSDVEREREFARAREAARTGQVR